jgi:hypothetical protein
VRPPALAAELQFGRNVLRRTPAVPIVAVRADPLARRITLAELDRVEALRAPRRGPTFYKLSVLITFVPVFSSSGFPHPGETKA